MLLFKKYFIVRKLGGSSTEYIQYDAPSYIKCSHCSEIGKHFTFMASSQRNKKRIQFHTGLQRWYYDPLYVFIGLIRSTLTLFPPPDIFQILLCVLCDEKHVSFIII